MTVFWWIVLVLALLTLVPAAVCFSLYLMNGEDRFMEGARGFFRWFIVVALGSLNFTIFKHIILTLRSF
jgi:hypothetical protein